MNHHQNLVSKVVALKLFVGRTSAVATAAVFGLMLIGATPSPGGAAEIKLLSPFSLRALLPDLLPKFETSSGHKVTVEYATVGVITERLLKGEAADATMVSAVALPRTISTRRMMFAGLKKWVPITMFGREVTANPRSVCL